MTNTLAVCITYYNEGLLITECLRTLYANTRLPDEVLVYDDASADPAAQYLTDFPQVRLIRKDINRGPGYSRDQLILASRCNYVHLHDADDRFHPEWCDYIYQATETQPDIILTSMERVWDEVRRESKPYWLEALSTPVPANALVTEAVKHGILPTLLTFKRELALEVGGHRWREVIAMGEDTDFSHRLAAASQSYVYIDKKLVIKHERAESYSQSYDSEKFRRLYNASHLKIYSLDINLKTLPKDANEVYLSYVSSILHTPLYIAPPLYNKVLAYIIYLRRSRRERDGKRFKFFHTNILDALSIIVGYRSTLAIWGMLHRIRGLFSRRHVSTTSG